MDINKQTQFQYHSQNFGNLSAAVNHRITQELIDFIAESNCNEVATINGLFKIPTLKVNDVFKKVGQIQNHPAGKLIRRTKSYVVPTVVTTDRMYHYFQLKLFANADNIKNESEKIGELLKEFTYIGSLIETKWMYDTTQGLESSYLYDLISVKVHPEAYPYIDDLKKYIYDYLNSSSSLLILLGPPGTGKTKLIKHIINIMAELFNKTLNFRNDRVEGFYRNENFDPLTITYSTSQKAYQEDSFFIDFIQSDSPLMVLEDIDFNLADRKSGNTFMHKLLGASDGIVGLLDKKIILSTNLSSDSKIDSALIRPGRCHDILHTRALIGEEITALAEVLNISIENITSTTKLTLAEIYNGVRHFNTSTGF